MSSSGCWDEDQGSSRLYQRVRRLYQRVRRISMQPAELSEDCVSSSQPPELEDKSSQAKTVKSGSEEIVPQEYEELSECPEHYPLTFIKVWFWVLLVMTPLVMMPHNFLVLKSGMSPLLLLKKVLEAALLVLVVLVLKAALPVVVPVLVQTLDRIMNFWCACMHRQGGRLVKWGPHEWVLDSGASNHHTSNLELLLQGGDFQSQEMNNKDAPSSGDDAAAPDVQGCGSVRTDCFDFPGVHYVVGDDTRNVVSVSQLARDHGLVTVFEPTSCHVKDKKTRQIVGKGRLHNGMYMLDSLHIIGQYIGDGGASGGDRHDGGDGGGGGRGHKARGKGEGDSKAKGCGGDGRDVRGGGTGARNQESGSGVAGGDVNEVNEEGEGGDEKGIEEMNGNDEDNIKEFGEINGKEEKEEDDKRGGQNFGQLSPRPYTGLFGLSACIVWCVLFACCVLKLENRFHIQSLGAAGVAILGLQLLKTSTMQSTICKLKQILGYLLRGTSGDRECTEGEKTRGAYVRESSHQEYNKRLFGLSRFDETTDPTGYWRRQMPARAFASSTNTARPQDFFVDSGAAFHTTWRESILFPYPQQLQSHTKPPTLSLGGIAAGSIAVIRTGYLNGNNIMLDGVLLAPEAQANLVSVGQLSIYYRVQVEMDEVGVVIKKKQNGVQIGGGRMVDHLYVLDYFRPGGLFAHCFTPHP